MGTVIQVHSQDSIPLGGMFFYSHEKVQEKRTTLNLTPEEPLYFREGFELAFKVKFRSGNGYYGNIIRIICNNKINLDLIANLNSHPKVDKAGLSLVLRDSVIAHFDWSKKSLMRFDEWMDIELKVDRRKSICYLNINGSQKSVRTEAFSNLDFYEFIFGKSDYEGFWITDVAPMSLREIVLRSINEEDIPINWPLSKHTLTDNVYSESFKYTATSKNARWLLDDHIKWNKEAQFHFKNLLGFTSDSQKGRVFFIESKRLLVYQIKDGTLDTLSFTGNPFDFQGNAFVYQPRNNQIWSYSLDTPVINSFNFNTKSWSLDTITQIGETAFWNHAKLVSSFDNSLITFGGYGFFKYKSALTVYNADGSLKSQYNSADKIAPRYLSSMGEYKNNRYLIYGGYGSRTGEQMENSGFFYDLHEVSIDPFDVRRLWNVDTFEDSPFVPVESMVVDEKNDGFYTLVFNNLHHNTYLRLAKFNLEKPGLTLYKDSIPYKFKDVRSNADIFLDSTQNKLVTIVREEGNVNIYTLNYPPLAYSDVIYDRNVMETQKNNFIWLLVIILPVGVFIFIYFKRKKAIVENRAEQGDDTGIGSVENINTYPNFDGTWDTSSILVFGGFQAFDANGKEITSSFTPKLQEVFVTILCASIKSKKGITSNSLTELIWFDKSEASAKNNRNVNISKLRLLLSQVGRTVIENKNTYWSISFGSEIRCDLLEVNSLIAKNRVLTDSEIVELLNLVL
ncbi:hypothetical protein HX109_13000 [Galbibacter sp. BG1]|uniref:hypothetical protein n=1 Tax=Galbibacter sp. BG1 TaxID=1170699 RepID=UPI0015BB5A3A|nr:hypothetical protein [Galbibacter sp. BG1]QLE02428.1 hypothetical protein HX109_13000 [Galbibacter sp. BG1]